MTVVAGLCASLSLPYREVETIVLGNGTASRETEEFLSGLLKEKGLKIPYLIVDESGASVYSASPISKEELPDLELNLRSAVSLARRVLDPLAELVKIDPKSIGVGQYQHDRNQKRLDTILDGWQKALWTVWACH